MTSEDSLPLAGRTVLLHEVSGNDGMAIDSVLTDRLGRYRFALAAPDTSSRYYVSVEFHDIGYFSSPLRLEPGASDTVPAIVVYDTSYASPEITQSERHIIVRWPDVDGTRQVIELITIRNAGRVTRIAADTSTPVWEGALPPGAFDFVLGESEVASGAIYLRRNRLAIAAPIPPGEKQVLFSYMLPRVEGVLELIVDQPVRRLTISFEDTTAAASGGNLVLYGVENVGGTVFKRFDAGNLSAGTRLAVTFQTPFLSVDRLKIFIVVAVTLALAGTLTWWMQRHEPLH